VGWGKKLDWGIHNSKKGLALSWLLLCGIAVASPSFRRGNPPSEFARGFASHPEALGVLHEKVSFPNVGLRPLSGNRFQLSSRSESPHLVTGMPQVPVSVRRYSLPPGQTAIAHLENVQWEESTETVSLSKTPVPLVWGTAFRPFPKRTFTGKFFPGKLVATREAEGEVFVSVFPAQVEMATGKVMVVRSADLRVEYVPSRRELVVPDIWSAPALIITSEKMKGAAERLRRFHAEELKVRSEVVYVETIAAQHPPVSEEDLPDGYKTKKPWDGLVQKWDEEAKTGYDYLTARKIIYFLQQKMRTGGATRYVTILGDATIVPPSYYVMLGEGGYVQIGVTDQCYAARNRCMEPRLAVGRLPFSDGDQLDTYLSKAKRWLRQGQDSTSELSLFGGKAFPSDIYVGELSSLKTVNQARDDWRGLKKYFRTHGKYDKSRVLDLVRGKVDSSFVYFLDHGSGNVWHIDEESISSKEVSAAGVPGASSPFIASISCINGAFDEKVLAESVFSDPRNGDVSVGVALLRSPSGAVGYLGAPRPSLGVPVYEVDKKGNLTLNGTTHALQFLDTFFAKYRDARKGRVGDILMQAYRGFLNESGNDMEDEDNIWTYFNLVLLGDPAMRLPDRGAGETVHPFAQSTLEMTTAPGGSFPSLNWVSGDLVFPVAASTEITATLLRMPRFSFAESEEQLDEKVLGGSGEYKVALPADATVGRYLLRLENRQGVPFERQVWFEVRKQSEGSEEVELSPLP